MEDHQGKGHPICSWTESGDDIIGMIPRMARIVDSAEALLGANSSRLSPIPRYTSRDWTSTATMAGQ